jgi:hypothetical protein
LVGAFKVIPILRPDHHWICPNCDVTHITHEQQPHTPFHSCRGLRGLTAPFIPEGIEAKVEACERGDYIGKEDVQLDGEGRPIMAVVTTRDEGQDCVVLAPTAKMSAHD